MKYIDGYVPPVSKKNLNAYQTMARQAATVWLEYGALEFKECAGDDLAVPFGVTFLQNLQLKKGETAIFAFIVFKSRNHRDRVNAKVWKDERIVNMMKAKKSPFDSNRMVYGGFKNIVDL
jgi:uncharacterized protein YbaA (DUF1428 family)